MSGQGGSQAAMLRAWREYRNLTPAVVARRAGLSLQCLSALEDGQASLAGSEKDQATLERLAHALGIFPAEILQQRMPGTAYTPADTDLFRRILLSPSGHLASGPSGGATAPGVQQQIQGVKGCVSAAIGLLESVPQLPQAHSNQIVLTWCGRESRLDVSADSVLRERWINALCIAVGRGWDLLHLVQLEEDNPRKSAILVLNMLALLGKPGLYVLRLLAVDPQPPEERRDYLLVPGFGGLELFGLNEAIAYTEPGPELQDLWNRVSLMRETSRPVYETYPPMHAQDLIVAPQLVESFAATMTQVEQQDGDRWVAMDGLSESTEPPEVLEMRIADLPAQGGIIADLANHLLAERRRRTAARDKQLKVWRYYDIFSLRAVRRLAYEGIYSDDDPLLLLGADGSTKEQRILHLRELIRLCRNPNYRMILLPDDQADLCRTFYLAKAGYAALLVFRHLGPHGQDERLNIRINELTLVRAFCDNPVFSAYQQTFTPHDKRKVIREIEGQIARLERAP